MFPTLTISSSEFHTNDGRVLNLLKAQGTVPIHYQVGGWPVARRLAAARAPNTCHPNAAAASCLQPGQARDTNTYVHKL